MDPLDDAGRATLVVVDMQERLSASNDPATVRAVIRLIELAIERQWGIVFLEYDGYGKTLQSLLAKVEPGYDRWTVESKPDKDGSEMTRDACQSYGWSTSRFIVCGVNLDACVVWTANGLARLFPQSPIDVVAEACNSENPAMWDTWRSFVAHDSIAVVSLPSQD